MNRDPKTQGTDHILIRIKVIPKASKNEIAGWEGGVLKIRIQAVPEKGEANAMLIKFLAKILSIAKSRIKIISGETSRQKKIKIEGMDKLPNF